MIGRPEWFTRRKYLGWGVMPKTWQGWAYIAAAVIPIFAIQYIGFWSEKTKMIATGIWAVILIADFFDIMIRMKKDEREKIHEAIAERNAMWAMIIVLTAGIGYEAASSAVKQALKVDPFIIAALFAALIVKAVSNVYLDKRD